MPLWESLCHALATAGTGGFSTRTLGVAAFHSPVIESIIAVFMLIFGVNLKLVWLFVTGRTAQALKNEEFRWYAGLFLLFWLMIAGSLILDGKALVNALGLAFSKPPAPSARPVSQVRISIAGHRFAGCFCP